jgi:putative endonuclease
LHSRWGFSAKRSFCHSGKALMAWFVYIVSCADGSYYTGICTNVGRRLAEHNHSNRLGARYTRGRRPVALAYTEETPTRAVAARREYEIRRLDHRRKELLVTSQAKAQENSGETAPAIAGDFFSAGLIGSASPEPPTGNTL